MFNRYKRSSNSNIATVFGPKDLEIEKLNILIIQLKEDNSELKISLMEKIKDLEFELNLKCQAVNSLTQDWNAMKNKYEIALDTFQVQSLEMEAENDLEFKAKMKAFGELKNQMTNFLELNSNIELKYSSLDEEQKNEVSKLHQQWFETQDTTEEDTDTDSKTMEMEALENAFKDVYVHENLRNRRKAKDLGMMSTDLLAYQQQLIGSDSDTDSNFMPFVIHSDCFEMDHERINLEKEFKNEKNYWNDIIQSNFDKYNGQNLKTLRRDMKELMFLVLNRNNVECEKNEKLKKSLMECKTKYEKNVRKLCVEIHDLHYKQYDSWKVICYEFMWKMFQHSKQYIIIKFIGK